MNSVFEGCNVYNEGNDGLICSSQYNKGNAERSVSPRLNVRPCELDL